MSYVSPDYPSKKAFKEAVAAGRKHETYNLSGMVPAPQSGSDVIEGPHDPKPHRWYCKVKVQAGIVVSAEEVQLPTAEEEGLA